MYTLFKHKFLFWSMQKSNNLSLAQICHSLYFNKHYVNIFTTFSSFLSCSFHPWIHTSISPKSSSNRFQNSSEWAFKFKFSFCLASLLNSSTFEIFWAFHLKLHRKTIKSRECIKSPRDKNNPRDILTWCPSAPSTRQF